MRRISGTALLMLLASATFAQVATHYHKFDIGAGYSIKNVISSPGVDHNIKFLQSNMSFNFTPFVSAVGEIQTGKMKGQFSGIAFSDRYTSLVGRFQVQGGAFIDFYQNGFTDLIKNLYIGTGLGVQDFSQKLSGHANKSTRGLFVPVRTGYEIKLFANNAVKAKFDLAYQYNLSGNKGQQGFRANAYNPTGHQFSLGIKLGIARRAAFGRAIN